QKKQLASKRITKHTAAGIPTWSPTVVLICRSTAYVWQSGRDAQFSADCGRMCLFTKSFTIYSFDNCHISYSRRGSALCPMSLEW
ncbi:hypothetical protein KCU67_g14637, partial [Aureobasidium melanogenum]